MNNIPTLYMMVGLPASGKSYLSAQLVSQLGNVIIHSSDAIREKLYGSADIQGDPNKVFRMLYHGVKNDLLHGKDVCIDSTNLSKKRRIHHLKSIQTIPCNKVCICVITPYEECIRQNQIRTRQVPADVLHRMYLNWNPPHKSEGWDRIEYVCRNVGTPNEFYQSFCKLDSFDQMNCHHHLSLGAHCKATAAALMLTHPEDNNLIIAALLHDIGKPFTQTLTKKKNTVDGNCHYYQHHCVGAYDATYILLSFGIPYSDVSDITNLIFYHMRPYNEWKHSLRCFRRDVNLLGEDFVSRVIFLHEADRKAH